MILIGVVLYVSLALPLATSLKKQETLIIGLGQTADGLTNEVEAIDLLDPSMSFSLPNYPYSVEGAFGTSIFPIFCGGHNSTDYLSDCLSLDFSSLAWVEAPKMNEKRAFGFYSSTGVIGGLAGTSALASSEFLDFLFDWEWKPAPYPDLPVKVYQHCVAVLPLSGLMVIGGTVDGSPSRKTYIYSNLLGEWSEGPELNVPRTAFSCGTISPTGEVIVAGGYNADGYLSSSEVLMMEVEGWQFGPDLPEPICCAGHYDQANGGLYIIGGSTPNGGYLDTVYKIASVDYGWVKVNAKLNIARSFPAISKVSLG